MMNGSYPNQAPEQNGAPLTFQQSMSRLQNIVNELSNPSLELERAMTLFEEGLKLSRSCEDQLNAFEKQMNSLMQANGLAGGSQ